LQKQSKSAKAFLIFFIAALSLKRIANLFGATFFYFLNIKAWENKPCP
jgi:hypothetical protein